jgi:hypothetical protein
MPIGRSVRGGIAARHMGRDRAVVDDAPALRVLALHHPEGVLSAEERAGEIDCDHIRPLLVGQVFEGDAAGLIPALLNNRSMRP